MQPAIKSVLEAYGLDSALQQIMPFGSGLINHTFKITGPTGSFVLQEINSSVFKSPQAIAENLILIDDYLKTNSPGYLFAAPLKAKNGNTLVRVNDKWYRLLPFIAESYTVDFLTDSTQACEAANQFGTFTALLKNFNPGALQYTLPNFHNLTLRIQQFKTALANATKERISDASLEIQLADRFKYIADTYEHAIDSKLPLRVIHHDTKINNVLFNKRGEGLCVIDLDTVMPGYFISDVGDMMRTYLAEASEEEQDLDKILIRDEFFKAIYEGYMKSMAAVLTAAEKAQFIYAGKFMIYMQALRFLTDFLNGDVYYQTKYPGHNLIRAKNQFKLLSLYCEKEEVFKKIIEQSR